MVAITYDKHRLPTWQLLTEFFVMHDFEKDRDRKRGQYRSAIFVTDPGSFDELTVAHRMLAHLRSRNKQPVTQVAKVNAFYPAEGRHQQYCTTRGLTPRRRDNEALRELLREANKSPE